MLEAIEHAVERNLVSLPKAIAQGTTNVAKAIPLLAPNLGLLEKGYTADILVTAYPQVSKVERIYIDGKLVAKDGKRLTN